MVLVIDEALCRERPSWSDRFDELVDYEGDGSWCGQVRGDMRFSVDGDRIRVWGELEGLVPRECAISLRHYLEPVQADLSEMCLVTPGVDVGEAVFDEDAEVWRVALGGHLSITELVRQAVLLALPTRAVCDDSSWSAPGEAEADQDPRDSSVDPRLAILQRLLKDQEENDGGSEAQNQ